MKVETNDKGFEFAKFNDLYGEDCLIQKSSLAETNAIWFGAGKDKMLLNQKQVAELLPILQTFVDTGELS